MRAVPQPLDERGCRDPYCIGVYQSLERPPLNATRLTADLARNEAIWRKIQVLDRTESTNAVVAEQARAGAAEGLVVVAEEQTAGRGRLDRAWTSPARAGLTFSVLLRPQAPLGGWGWLPLLSGLAVVDALSENAGLASQLKWPNDLLVAGAKCAGILCEVVAGAVIIGIGLNVTTTKAELPHPGTTSLALAGATTTDRATILKSVLRALERRYEGWHTDPVGLRAAYLSTCATIGQQVSVAIPGGRTAEGECVDVDLEGQLIVQTANGTIHYAAGDVVHVRSEDR